MHKCVNKSWHISIVFVFFSNLSVAQGEYLPLIVLSGNNPLAKWNDYSAKGFNLKSQSRKQIIAETTKTLISKYYNKTLFLKTKMLAKARN